MFYCHVIVPSFQGFESSLHAVVARDSSLELVVSLILGDVGFVLGFSFAINCFCIVEQALESVLEVNEISENVGILGVGCFVKELSIVDLVLQLCLIVGFLHRRKVSVDRVEGCFVTVELSDCVSVICCPLGFSCFLEVDVCHRDLVKIISGTRHNGFCAVFSLHFVRRHVDAGLA